jgi:nicotinic acid phosphoribosyltransferase
VLGYNIETKKNIIVDSYNISHFQKLNEDYSLYITDKQINETIEKFIKESVKEEYFFLKLKPELLNILLNFKLIDEEYAVYDEEKELNNKDFVNISEKLIENEIIPKIKLFHINISNLEEEKVLNYSTLSFSKKDSKEYIFKIKTSNYKYILDNFPDIKTIDINEYIIL